MTKEQSTAEMRYRLGKYVLQVLLDAELITTDGRLIRHELMDTAVIDTECEELLKEMDVVAGLIQKCVNENAVQAID